MRFFVLRTCALFLALLWSASFLDLSAQDPVLTSFGSAHGLPLAKINHIVQDDLGYLWLGSNVGLHQFDGKSIKSFSSRTNDNYDLPKGEISHLQVTSNGDILLAIVAEGIFRYNRDIENFSKIELPDFEEIGRGRYMDILNLDNGDLYIADSDSGVYFLDIKSGRVRKILNIVGIGALLKRDLKDEIILAGVGLFSLDLQTQEVRKLDDQKYFEAVIDDNEVLWGVNTRENKLISYDLSQDLAKNFINEIDKDIIYENLIYDDGEFWISTSNGIRIFDTESSKWSTQFTTFPESENHPDFAVYDLMQDEDGVFWFSQNNMLHAVDPQNQKAKQIPLTTQYTYVTGAVIDEDHVLFAPFDGNELHLINAKSNEVKIIEGTTATGEFNSPFDLVKVKDKVWIFYINGIATYDIKTEKIHPITLEKYNDYFRSTNKKKAMYDGAKYIWVNDFQKEIIWRIDPISMQVDSMHVRMDPEEKREFSLSPQKDGGFLYYEANNIFDVDFDNKLVQQLHQNGAKVELGYIYQIQNVESKLWLISDGVLCSGSRNGNEYSIDNQYLLGNTQNNSECLSVTSDNQGNIFALTASGIHYYIQNEDRFITYGVEEGFKNLGFRTRLECIGDYVFSLEHGIYKMKISDFQTQKELATTHIESVYVNGERFQINSEITLNYKQNDVFINFNAVDLTKALEVSYKHRLNEENEWIYSDYKSNTAVFTDLRPGQYTFEVASKGKFSDWGYPSTFEFEIRPPFWRTWWFLLSLLILTGSGIYFLMKKREKEIRRISLMETKMAELENEALRAQMNPHFIFNSLNSIKAFIINNDRNMAADYLTNFSELIRTILSNSREKLISLKDELDALKLYIDIENIRLEDKFDYNLHIDSNFELEQFLIPPLTLQPFVENSIWHGLVHKPHKGSLDIFINKEADALIINIKDDGVGRKKSQEIEKNHRRHRSFGILITSQRLGQAEAKEGLKEDKILITDLYNDQKQASGTNVRIKLPIINSKQETN